MNVKELRDYLEGFPGHLEVIVDQYSDYSSINRDTVSLVEGVKKQEWIMRKGNHMGLENNRKVEEYLHIGPSD